MKSLRHSQVAPGVTVTAVNQATNVEYAGTFSSSFGLVRLVGCRTAVTAGTAARVTAASR